jgi:hypothetical protein
MKIRIINNFKKAIYQCDALNMFSSHLLSEAIQNEELMKRVINDEKFVIKIKSLYSSFPYNEEF